MRRVNTSGYRRGAPIALPPIDWRGLFSTDKQHSMLKAMCTGLGRDLVQLSTVIFHKRDPRRMTRGEAHSLIELLLMVKRDLEKFGDHADKVDDIPY